ncbi:hypothetical protein [Capnocytophaga canis]|uniref:hypothetical protein n=1 Tax=Capnocytophaga canis TaxID=1848903 RepID=UPI001561E274|nr:hypothetical protein [Capnocytophaga canis]
MLKSVFYGDIENLINRMSSVTVTFNLSPIDFAQFDLYSTIYVKQLRSPIHAYISNLYRRRICYGGNA